jgi:hypothetical protein
MTAPPNQALCLGCNYPLHNLTEPRCPECGVGFDPADAGTMNLGRPIGAWGRRFIRPVGWPTVVLALLATVLILSVSPFRGWARPNDAELKLAARTAPHFLHYDEWFEELTVRDRVYVAGCLWFVIAMGVWGTRMVLRWLTLMVRRPGKALWGRAWRKQVVVVGLLAISAGLILFAWPGRMAWHYAAKWNPLPPQLARTTGPIRELHEPQVLRFGLMHMPANRRADFLRLIVEDHPKLAELLLTRAVKREDDPGLRCDELRVLGLLRKVELAGLIESFLGDPSAQVRAATIDALGILRAPAYPVRLYEEGLLPLNGGEKIALEPLLRLSASNSQELDISPIDLPASVRDRIEQLMLTGTTSAEREAGARALVNWPPKGYQLRYAEWGVWLSDHGEMKLARRMLEANPPFVHQTHNAAAGYEKRLPGTVFISNKPVVHLTAEQPLAVDVGIMMHRGRPWSAYPRPDDFELETVEQDVSGRLMGPPSPDMRFGVPVVGGIDTLERPGVSLDDLWQGFPWLSSAHGSRPIRFAVNTVPQIVGLGLRWQSLIVSPKQLPWMNMPAIPADPKYAWWDTVRSVHSSYLSNRDEAERFLFYDGPTLAKFPIDFLDRGDHLEVGPNLLETANTIHPTVEDTFVGVRATKDRPYAFRSGMFVEVKPGKTAGYRIDLPASIDRQTKLELDPLKRREDVDVFKGFWDMLAENGAGLTTEESGALIQTWTKEFFFTPGRRLLLVMSAADYDAMCPLTIRPRPTEMARVGIVVWEFK